MKKYYYVLMTFLAVIFTMPLTSCGDDDDEEGGDEGNVSQTYGSIQINRKKYEIDPFITMEGYWDKDKKEGTFTVSVFEMVGSSKDCLYYVFSYMDDKQPKVGDNFADKSLTLEPLDGKAAAFAICDYDSGSAKVVSIDKSKALITIQFDHLSMRGNGYSYTFNGKAPVDFNFGRTSW